MDQEERATFYYLTKGSTNLATGVKGVHTPVALLRGSTYLDKTKVKDRTANQNKDVGRINYKDRVFVLERNAVQSVILEGVKIFDIKTISISGIISYKDQLYEILTVEVDDKVLVTCRGTGKEYTFHRQGEFFELSMTMSVEYEVV